MGRNRKKEEDQRTAKERKAKDKVDGKARLKTRLSKQERITEGDRERVEE